MLLGSPRLRKIRSLTLAAAVAGTLALCPLAAPAQPATAGRATLLSEQQFADGDDRIRVFGEAGLVAAENIVFGTGRTTITRGDVTIEADSLRIDRVTQEVSAEGNVIYRAPDTEIRASRGRYNFRANEGVAWDVEGVKGPVFFRSAEDEETEGVSFRRISEDQALFRGATYTTSGFPVPTWHLKADEIIIIPGDRVFMRSATLYVRDVPVFWFPVYTRAFDESNPWTLEAGFRSRYGGYFSLGYLFRHEARVPDWEDPERLVYRSRGELRLRGDLFTSGTVGIGTDYEYEFGFRRHIGDLSLYGVRDTVRNTVDEDNDREDSSETENRYIYRHRHNSMFGQTIWQLNADWMSDPDIYEDFVDPLISDQGRGRPPERRIRAAVTYFNEDWLARLSGELKERVTLDEYIDPAEPLADNLLFDPDPDIGEQDNEDIDGISRDRYGRVTERVQGRVATRLLPFFNTPFYWRTEANAFSALDTGFNEGGTEDDTRYNGGDFYTAATHRLRLDDRGRFTWMNTVGVGAGSYNRSDDSLLGDDSTGMFPQTTGGLTFPSEESVLISNGNRRLDYDDVDPTFVWVDYRSRLSARMSENLAGYVQYTLRRASGFTPGDFWEKSGRQEAFEDVYPFITDQQWADARLTYSPLLPALDMYLTGGYNLDSENNIYPNEKLYYAGTGMEWQNDTGEWVLASEVLYQGRQARDRRDPADYHYKEIDGTVSLDYLPRHGRYWAGIDVNGRVPLNDDPIDAPNALRRRYDEDRSDVTIRPLVGRQFGPKYQVEAFAAYSTRLKGISEAGVTVVRDIYDADVFVFGGIKENTFNERDDNDNSGSRPDSDTEFEVRVGLRFKTPEEQAGLSAVSMTTLRERQQRPAFVE